MLNPSDMTARMAGKEQDMAEAGTETQVESTHHLLSTLSAERDELRVRLHLARAEVRDDWHALEQRWEHFESRVRATRHAVATSRADTGAALELLGQELRKGYARVRRAVHC